MIVRSPVRGVIRSPVRSPASRFYGVSGYPGSSADLDFTADRYVIGGSAKTFAELFTGSLARGADGLEGDGTTNIQTTRTLLGMTSATEGAVAALAKAPSSVPIQRAANVGALNDRACVFFNTGPTQTRIEYRDATGAIVSGGAAYTPGDWEVILLSWSAAAVVHGYSNGPPRTVTSAVPSRTVSFADSVQIAGRDTNAEVIASGGRVARVLCFAGPLSVAQATDVIDFLGALRAT